MQKNTTFFVRSGRRRATISTVLETDPDSEIRAWLEEGVARYNHVSFIPDDPISVPHRFSKKQDIEIAGLFAALMAWGQRVTIIRKANELMRLMDDAPHDFIRNHVPQDRKRICPFVHRTLQSADVMFLIEVLQEHYCQSETLEDVFVSGMNSKDENVFGALSGFHRWIFDRAYFLERTRKHIATPERKSSCKRLNMYLRWMVRKDNAGVDFGIWNRIRTDQLLMPLDVHVSRVARHLKLLERKQDDWEAAIELTQKLKVFDPIDPIRYDYALFGSGVLRKK